MNFEVADYDFYVTNRKFIMADSIWWPLLIKFDFFFVKSHKNTYGRVFEVADHDVAVKMKKIKMADSIGRPFLTKFEVFSLKVQKNAYGRQDDRAVFE